jgi:hypothetical protein
MPKIRKAEAQAAPLKDLLAEKNQQQAILRHESAEIKAESLRLKEDIVRWFCHAGPASSLRCTSRDFLWRCTALPSISSPSAPRSWLLP